MSTQVLLTTPLVINSVTYNDGDYIQLSLPIPASDTVPNYRGIVNTTNTPAYFDSNIYAPVYSNQTQISIIGNSQYHLAASIPQYSQSITYYDTSGAQTNYGATGTGNIQATPQLQYSGADGYAYMGKDAVMAPSQAAYFTETIMSANGSISRGNAMTDTYQSSDNVTNIQAINTLSDVRLVLEYHGDDLVALRSVDGLYLHMKNVYTMSSNSSIKGVVPNIFPQALTVTYSSEPSELPSAQWHFYQSQSSTNVILYNRGYQCYLQLQNAGMQPQTNLALTRYSGAGSANINVISKLAATYYGNGWVQNARWISTVMQPYWRLNATSTLSQASSFRATRIPLQGCDVNVSPSSTACISLLGSNTGNVTVVPALMQFCSSGDLAFTPNCQTFILNQNESASALVNASCSRHPNNMELCACVNYKPPYYEVIELLRLNNTSFLPQCNASDCATNVGVLAWVSQIISCVSKICIQGINLTGTGVKVNNVNFNCDVGSGTSGSDTTAPISTGATPSITDTISKVVEVTNLFLRRSTASMNYFTIFVSVLIFCFIYLILTTTNININPIGSVGVFLITFLLFFIR